jgi:hypothetical protein
VSEWVCWARDEGLCVPDRVSEWDSVGASEDALSESRVHPVSEEWSLRVRFGEEVFDRISGVAFDADHVLRVGSFVWVKAGDLDQGIDGVDDATESIDDALLVAGCQPRRAACSGSLDRLVAQPRTDLLPDRFEMFLRQSACGCRISVRVG